MSIHDDPLLGQLVDTPEKRAKWMYRLKIAQLLWLVFVVLGIVALLVWWIMQN